MIYVRPEERVIPLVIKWYRGEVTAFFPTRRSSHYEYIVCWAFGRGEFEFPLDQLKAHRLKAVNLKTREQMLTLLGNVGYKNLRFYKEVRPWMHRDRFKNNTGKSMAEPTVFTSKDHITLMQEHPGLFSEQDENES